MDQYLSLYIILFLNMYMYYNLTDSTGLCWLVKSKLIDGRIKFITTPLTLQTRNFYPGHQPHRLLAVQSSEAGRMLIRYGGANYDPFEGSRCFDFYDYDDSDFSGSDNPGFNIQYEGVSLPRRNGPQSNTPESHTYDVELSPRTRKFKELMQFSRGSSST